MKFTDLNIHILTVYLYSFIYQKLSPFVNFSQIIIRAEYPIIRYPALSLSVMNFLF